MPDDLFALPRLAAIYAALDAPERVDLDPYLALADELDARSVLDIGCGKGVFARRLAATGRKVVAIDPAAASVDVARGRPGAESVEWIVGECRALSVMQIDLATMTGNVAHVFLSDEEWLATLAAAYTALRPGGTLVFETRDPSRRAWDEWTRELTYGTAEIDGETIENWVELEAVKLPFVSFKWFYRFSSDGAEIVSRSVSATRTRS